MCGVCGCSNGQHPHHLIQIEQDLLAKNNEYAEANRAYFSKRKICALNIMSSPGSGKTTLLCKSIEALQKAYSIAVIVGDQQTELDAEQLKKTGVPALQINTGKACHLDAHMLGHALEDMNTEALQLLFIENVGNLVCPALFNLGESCKVVLLSVTEGDNKPLKYPEMFHQADLMILTKIDLLPYVDFNPNKAIEYAKRINPAIQSISLSATTGQGLAEWLAWLSHMIQNPK